MSYYNDDELMEERSFRASGDEDNDDLETLEDIPELGLDEDEIEKDNN